MPPEEKIDPQDILIVQNIDLSCDMVDPEFGFSHKEYFEVRWDNIPHRIAPGQTRRMPRYIAEHFAKHLIDHMLMRAESETGKKNLVGNKLERAKMHDKIILGVQDYFLGGNTLTEGEKVAEEVERLNTTDKPLETTEVVEPVTPDEEVPERTNPIEEKKTRSELLIECETLGIETTGKETVDELYTKIKNF